jgi:hypothetical protein
MMVARLKALFLRFDSYFTGPRIVALLVSLVGPWFIAMFILFGGWAAAGWFAAIWASGFFGAAMFGLETRGADFRQWNTDLKQICAVADENNRLRGEIEELRKKQEQPHVENEAPE